MRKKYAMLLAQCSAIALSILFSIQIVNIVNIEKNAPPWYYYLTIFAKVDWEGFTKVNQGRVVRQGQKVMIPLIFTEPEYLKVLKNNELMVKMIRFGDTFIEDEVHKLAIKAPIADINEVPFTLWFTITVPKEGRFKLQPHIYMGRYFKRFNVDMDVVSFDGKVAFAESSENWQKAFELLAKDNAKGILLTEQQLEHEVDALRQRYQERYSS